MPARILYGVQGEGRGHAARSLQVIQWLLAQGHEVLVLTGGDALPVLEGKDFPLAEIPMVRYRFGPGGALSPRRTLFGNALPALGLLTGMGKSFASVSGRARAFRPDVIISDFEPYLSRLARLRRIPLLAIDHQHFLTESALPALPGWQKSLMLRLYQLGTFLLAGRPDRIITSSFYHFPKKPRSRAVFVGPFIPDTLKNLRPEHGECVTVYLKQPTFFRDLFPVLARQVETRFEIFSAWKDGIPTGLPSHVHLSRIDREAFLASLSRSRALVTTAGNQVIGEAIYLCKPVLAFPEPDVLEQELNALALVRSGFGDSFRLEEFSPEVWERFLSRLPVFRTRLEAGFRDRNRLDGRGRTLRVLRRFLRDIPGPGRLPAQPLPSFS